MTRQRHVSDRCNWNFRANGLRDEDEGAFAIAQALKPNEDVRLTLLNLMNIFLTKLGQSAITDASDHYSR
ncbi:hypothetical protein AAHA92_02863 [Salvia divinorum]|uniref:Uncharacterized protein n=1 Tax=Salvia divinorum TaxID=28513 RepID=A0ABD1IGA5_SALDI